MVQQDSQRAHYIKLGAGGKYEESLKACTTPDYDGRLKGGHYKNQNIARGLTSEPELPGARSGATTSMKV